MKTIYQHTCVDRTPFTYYLKWSKTGISYYGCRYGINCHPTQLGVSYFSSSTHVKEYIEIYGIPDILKVTKIFTSIPECRKWESRFLIKTNAKTNKKLLNKSQIDYGLKSYYNVKTILKNMELKLLNIPFLKLKIEPNQGTNGRFHINFKNIIYLWHTSNDDRDDFLKNNPEWSHGRDTKEANEKISKALKGVKKPKRTEEHAKKIGAAQIGIKKPGSGPRKPIDYYEKIDNIKKVKLEKKLLRHRIFIYFLDLKIRISTYDELFDAYLSQGWSTTKSRDDYEYINDKKKLHLSYIHKNRVRPPRNFTDIIRKNISDGATRGHETRRKNNALKLLNLASL